MGNGIYDYSTTTAATTGSANTDATLFSRVITAGGLNDGNGLRLRCEFTGTGTAAFMLGGVNLLTDPWTVSGSDHIVEVEVWRVGRYNALARVWNATGGAQEALTPGGRFPVSGLDWQAGQTLAVIGQSETVNGLTLSRAGLAK